MDPRQPQRSVIVKINSSSSSGDNADESQIDTFDSQSSDEKSNRLVEKLQPLVQGLLNDMFTQFSQPLQMGLVNATNSVNGLKDTLMDALSKERKRNQKMLTRSFGVACVDLQKKVTSQIRQRDANSKQLRRALQRRTLEIKIRDLFPVSCTVELDAAQSFIGCSALRLELLDVVMEKLVLRSGVASTIPSKILTTLSLLLTPFFSQSLWAKKGCGANSAFIPSATLLLQAIERAICGRGKIYSKREKKEVVSAIMEFFAHAHKCKIRPKTAAAEDD